MSKFDKYLQSIGLDGAFLARANEVIDVYVALYGEEICDVFVSEYVDSNGMRTYDNLWLFSGSFACESKQFLKNGSFDAAAWGNLVSYWEMNKEKFDLEDPTPESRVSLSFKITTNVGGEIKATGGNCLQIIKILKTYIIPNMIKA